MGSAVTICLIDILSIFMLHVYSGVFLLLSIGKLLSRHIFKDDGVAYLHARTKKLKANTKITKMMKKGKN